MTDSRTSQPQGVTFLGALGLLFIGLKLGHVITWSWWWVTVPLWGGLAIVVAIGIPWLIVAGILDVRDARRRRALRARGGVASPQRTPISEHKDAE